jgi:NAD(P)-dependent dehydrogenase (short-subunit alcohol dehydrogenase family)
MDMETDLSGRIAVVTGAGSGLGAAMCRKFAAVGVAVAALDIDSENAAATAKLLAAEFGVPTLSQQVDVADRKSLADAASQIEAELGGCDVLCANVGVQQIGAIDRLSDDDWTWLINVNVLGTVRTVSAFLPLIRRRSGWRRIVLTSSSSALLPSVRLAAYQSSKFAVWGFGDSLRRELAEEGIGVTVIFPAGMPTRHLESSALARPPDKGESTLDPRDLEAMMANVQMTDADLATPDHAIRNLLADLQNDEPYLITHGSYRPQLEERFASILDAFDRTLRS